MNDFLRPIPTNGVNREDDTIDVRLPDGYIATLDAADLEF